MKCVTGTFRISEEVSFWAVTCVERKRSKVLEVGTAIPLIKAKELNKDIGAMVM